MESIKKKKKVNVEIKFPLGRISGKILEMEALIVLERRWRWRKGDKVLKVILEPDVGFISSNVPELK